MKRYLSLLLCVLILSCLFAGCGASSGADIPREAPEEKIEAAGRNEMAADSASGTDGLPESRKWIITCSLEAETDNLDTMLETLMETLDELLGYVENQELYNGRGEWESPEVRLTVRVPADRLDEFLSGMEESTHVISSSRNLRDITLEYGDTETRLKALRTEEARLLELMAQAETVSDLLEIEERLTEIRYDIENITSRLKRYDNQVDYATVYLTALQVQEYTPVEQPGFLQRIRTGFTGSLKGVRDAVVDFAVWLIVSMPYLILWALVILAGVLVVRKLRKNRKNRKKSLPPQEEKKP